MHNNTNRMTAGAGKIQFECLSTKSRPRISSCLYSNLKFSCSSKKAWQIRAPAAQRIELPTQGDCRRVICHPFRGYTSSDTPRLYHTIPFRQGGQVFVSLLCGGCHIAAFNGDRNRRSCNITRLGYTNDGWRPFVVSVCKGPHGSIHPFFRGGTDGFRILPRRFTTCGNTFVQCLYLDFL